jgi:Raf kinase inhibitor-like YbhB/YbcL family protein
MRAAPIALVSLLLACGSSAGTPPTTEDAAEGETPVDAATRPTPDAASDVAGLAASDAIADQAPSPAAPDAAVDATDHGGVDAAADHAALADSGTGSLQLSSTGFLMKGGDLIFPASASYPMDQSPPFAWSGAPTGTRSFALTFVDQSNGATKWVLWDIPADRMFLLGNISKTAHPTEVPGSSQRGSLGRTGYSGPGVPGPPLHVYEFVLWALDVQNLPSTDGVSTADLRAKLLPAHVVAKSPPLVAKGQEGGP